MLKLNQSQLTEQEREVLRRALLPRTKYLPKTNEEGCEIALQMLNKDKYDKMFAFLEEIRRRYGELECRWTRGDSVWDLYYSIKKGSGVFCRFGLCFDVFNLLISFGKSEREKFERERSTYPRDAIQWSYDMAAMERDIKFLMFDVLDEKVHPYLFRLLAYKRKPVRIE